MQQQHFSTYGYSPFSWQPPKQQDKSCSLAFRIIAIKEKIKLSLYLLVKHHTMNTYGGLEMGSQHSWCREEMELRGQLHASVDLLVWKEPASNGAPSKWGYVNAKASLKVEEN
jgi:hypothetical protein